MRIVVVATFLLAASALGFACSSFDADTPTALRDAGADDAPSTTPSDANADAPLVEPSDGGCDALFCDDFERSAADIAAGWERFEPMVDRGTIDTSQASNGTRALHIQLPTAEEESNIVSLSKVFPLDGAKLMTLDFEFYLEKVVRQSNLVAIRVRDSATTGQVLLFVITGTSFSLSTQVINGGGFRTMLRTAYPPLLKWNHVTVTLDFAATPARANAKLNGLQIEAVAGQTPTLVATDTPFLSVEPLVGVTYSYPGEPFDIWYDAVRLDLK